MTKRLLAALLAADDAAPIAQNATDSTMGQSAQSS